MRERRFVEVVQQVLQFFVTGTPWRESGPVGLAQRGYERIAVLPGDFAVLVSVAVVEARLLCHRGFLGSMNEHHKHYSRDGVGKRRRREIIWERYGWVRRSRVVNSRHNLGVIGIAGFSKLACGASQIGAVDQFKSAFARSLKPASPEPK